ncbi:MAG: TonB-dependent receptor [Chitinophagales bacterium]|nr:TonB-dependent receptor [Chitinophagales bacterium]
MRYSHLYLLIALFLCGLSDLSGQQDTLQSHISISEPLKFNTRAACLNYLSAEFGFLFSYNANAVNVGARPHTSLQSGTLLTVVEQIFYPDKVELTFIYPNKIVIQRVGESFRLSGIIKDVDTGEAIYGAIVMDAKTKTTAITNEKGYFIMQLQPGQHQISMNYLGYNKVDILVTLDKNLFLQLSMISSYHLDTIHIHNPTSRLQLIDGGNLVDVFKMQGYHAISGDQDVVNNARILPGVISAGEGLSGLYVRGGTPDQNLTMIDGVAMYESGHLFGITSIFMDESIKEASFIKNGFPARYGGRLSSVLDITLKEGDKEKNNTAVSAGFAGLKIHTDGPILKNKLTYSITTRASWLNFYINNLLRKYTKYEDIDLMYHDVLGKLTYHFSPSNSLSLALYNGSDKFSLTKSSTLRNEAEDFTLRVFDKNGINWANTVGSLKWNYLAGDKLSMKTQIGLINYTNNSRSSYIFNNILPDTSRVDQLDILSHTSILDYNARVDVDYYLNDNHVLRSGINVLKQRFNPTVKQSTIVLDQDAEKIVDKDSSLYTYQFQFYLEDNFKWNNRFFLYGGLHTGIFRINDKQYVALQPRLKAIWTPSDKLMVALAYSKMGQFTHLLSNSGLGLPSNLWVPSTEKIKPQYSDQWSAGITYDFIKGFYIQIGAYTRKMHNVLEYTTPVDMFYFLINDQNISTVFNTARDWERNVYAGIGRSKGIELLLHKNIGKITGWASVTRSETSRLFKEINDGKPFPATHDKPWDINTGLNVKLSNAWSLGADFVYNTGNAFSLATEEYDSYLGIKLLNSDGKNNYRLPDFHQMSLSALYRHKGKKIDTDFSLKLYNIYNRLNAYYIYIYKSNLAPDEPIFRKVSILPFTPSFSVSIIF